jgi:hypothetical protein
MVWQSVIVRQIATELCGLMSAKDSGTAGALR